MKRIYLICLLLSYQFASAQDNLKTDFQRIYEDINTNSEAYERLKYSTENLGHRLTGSEHGKKAEEHVFNLLKAYGYDVKYQPFSAQSWARESLSLKLNNSDVPTVSLAHSPVKVDLNADLVDLGNGLEADYQKVGDQVKGKIALVYLHILPNSGEKLKNLHRSEKTALAEKYGAKGIVFINSVKGNVLLTGTASITGKLIDIPAICIGFEDGMKWKEALSKEKVQAQINMRNKADEATARNIIVSIKGSELPEEKIVIGGHLDSWDLATGAIDNGLGSYAIIDMARAFKKLNLKPKRSIDFVLFMGEEQGLLGSKAYVAEAIKNGTLGQIKYMLNFDMTNAPTGFSTSREEMMPLLDSLGGIYATVDTDFKNTNASGAGLHSDHQPFMMQGIPTGSAAGGKLPNNAGLYYHSDNDVFSLVDKKGLEQTVKVGAAYLYALANAKAIPAQRFSDDEIVKFLESKGLKEPLMISGEWRWGK
ncbi:peptidase M28 [Sphingobacterium mizutaii NBRC 14946 = DSM 11724]|uniref:Carboxypeptidase Q n=2 Tax=Sphingobacterium mizutaii TaxID=1010 RepID=A0AAJ4X8C1_9SPHI|nr:M28 family peptidase [Sphingobacterium mizutaii]GEM69421.1 peptidase M28 [Sphingobacterium mizutaii NBRC 14946 = DSM 11724]SDL83006.1 Zn-dependent amino-or carboxypeptidase, M28 family [Sphingobacterium mizutaii]SNV38526.1 Arginyl aminopeptidase [Sphingobacterium mizutaii]